MAEAAAAGETPLLRGLPDEIVLWEILVCLPPKSLLRCRAVSPAWRRATSTHDFLLAHHGRQPNLPLLRGCVGSYLRIVPLDHRAGVAAADQLQYVARLGRAVLYLKASCEGLLILSDRKWQFSICNPATRQYASLPLLHGFRLTGIYPHPSTGEYRLLLNKDRYLMYDEPPCAEYACFVFTIGSGQPPRHIGFPDAGEMVCGTLSVVFHGSLHWYTGQAIMVFDTTAESFRQMRSPVVFDEAHLFEIDGMLAMYSLNDEGTIVHIWVMQDYEGEVWALKRRVELLVAEITGQLEKFGNHWSVVATSLDGDVLMLVRFGEWLLQVDINGKLVARFHCRGLDATRLLLKQTLVPHTFFPALEDYVVNAWPFI